jgi:2,4-dienoyl-CoA reductase-like NADH-dependent reductase (Old Yellow Enzyme family)
MTTSTPLSLFKPFQYKTLNLRNRFVMAPMTRSQSPNGMPTQAVVDYYTRRAEGEVGLILSEGTVIDRPASSNDNNIPRFHGPALAEWKKVIQSVHQHHGQMGPQIWHMGKMAPHRSGWLPPAPFEGPESMSIDDIARTIDAFAHSAGEARKLGFDCVELHGAHGYLIDQFFWEGMNQRTDRFGGKTIGERSRFALEVIQAVRKAIGPELALIIRLSQWKQQDYAAKLAHTPREMEEWLIPMAEAGVDLFHCSQRRFWEPEFEGSDLNFAGWAKKITGRPTITVGSVGLSGDFIGAFAKGESSTTQGLEELVRRFDRGDFDLVSVGRALLQDPNWVKKVKAGETDQLEGFANESLAKYF